jgi:Pentapeptide repeats (8 copies)
MILLGRSLINSRTLKREKMKIQRWDTGKVIYERKATVIKELLEKGVKEGIDFSYANLINADLFCANLNGTNLRWANLSYANLRGANLFCANLSRAELINTDLWRASLGKATLRGVNFSCANLTGADLRGADLSYANFNEANLRGADFRWATLSDANLRESFGKSLINLGTSKGEKRDGRKNVGRENRYCNKKSKG